MAHLLQLPPLTRIKRGSSDQFRANPALPAATGAPSMQAPQHYGTQAPAVGNGNWHHYRVTGPYSLMAQGLCQQQRYIPTAPQTQQHIDREQLYMQAQHCISQQYASNALRMKYLERQIQVEVNLQQGMEQHASDERMYATHHQNQALPTTHTGNGGNSNQHTSHGGYLQNTTPTHTWANPALGPPPKLIPMPEEIDLTLPEREPMNTHSQSVYPTHASGTTHQFVYTDGTQQHPPDSNCRAVPRASGFNTATFTQDNSQIASQHCYINNAIAMPMANPGAQETIRDNARFRTSMPPLIPMSNIDLNQESDTQRRNICISRGQTNEMHVDHLPQQNSADSSKKYNNNSKDYPTGGGQNVVPGISNQNLSSSNPTPPPTPPDDPIHLVLIPKPGRTTALFELLGQSDYGGAKSPASTLGKGTNCDLMASNTDHVNSQFRERCVAQKDIPTKDLGVYDSERQRGNDQSAQQTGSRSGIPLLQQMENKDERGQEVLVPAMQNEKNSETAGVLRENLNSSRGIVDLRKKRKIRYTCYDNVESLKFVSPQYKIMCFVCYQEITGRDVGNHLLFVDLHCRNCGLVINSCDVYVKLQNKEIPGCKGRHIHVFDRWTVSPLDFLGYNVKKFLMWKSGNYTHLPTNSELFQEMDRYIQKLLQLQFREPWKASIASFTRHVGIMRSLKSIATAKKKLLKKSLYSSLCETLNAKTSNTESHNIKEGTVEINRELSVSSSDSAVVNQLPGNNTSSEKTGYTQEPEETKSTRLEEPKLLKIIPRNQEATQPDLEEPEVIQIVPRDSKEEIEVIGYVERKGKETMKAVEILETKINVLKQPALIRKREKLETAMNTCGLMEQDTSEKTSGCYDFLLSQTYSLEMLDQVTTYEPVSDRPEGVAGVESGSLELQNPQDPSVLNLGLAESTLRYNIAKDDETKCHGTNRPDTSVGVTEDEYQEFNWVDVTTVNGFDFHASSRAAAKGRATAADGNEGKRADSPGVTTEAKCHSATGVEPTTSVKEAESQGGDPSCTPKTPAHDYFLRYHYPRQSVPEECPMCYHAFSPKMFIFSSVQLELCAECPGCGLQLFVNFSDQVEPQSKRRHRAPKRHLQIKIRKVDA